VSNLPEISDIPGVSEASEASEASGGSAPADADGVTELVKDPVKEPAAETSAKEAAPGADESWGAVASDAKPAAAAAAEDSWGAEASAPKEAAGADDSWGAEASDAKTSDAKPAPGAGESPEGGPAAGAGDKDSEVSDDLDDLDDEFVTPPPPPLFDDDEEEDAKGKVASADGSAEGPSDGSFDGSSELGGEAVGEVDRTRFLESLLDEGENVPRKVELDLDGIFDQARKEADELAPDSTRTPVTAPLPPDPEEEASESAEPAPEPEPAGPPALRKVSKFKLLFLVVPVAVGALGLLWGIYQFFIKSPVEPPAPVVVITPETLVDTREPVPGEMNLGRFLLTLDAEGDGEPAVAMLEIILHYHDTVDEQKINANMVILRDTIFRITQNRGARILKDPAMRRQLQADLLATLNSLPPFRTDQEHQFLTYVQISMLKGV
jgi:flagellar basal body-associated protein FliL